MLYQYPRHGIQLDDHIELLDLPNARGFNTRYLCAPRWRHMALLIVDIVQGYKVVFRFDPLDLIPYWLLVYFYILILMVGNNQSASQKKIVVLLSPYNHQMLFFKHLFYYQEHELVGQDLTAHH